MTAHNALRSAQNGPGRDETHEQAHRVVSTDGERTQGNVGVLAPPKRGAYGVKPIGQLCPECGMKSVTRQVLPLPAPVPPKGSCVVACGKCGYTAVVETRAWQEATP